MRVRISFFFFLFFLKGFVTWKSNTVVSKGIELLTNVIIWPLTCICQFKVTEHYGMSVPSIGGWLWTGCTAYESRAFTSSMSVQKYISLHRHLYIMVICILGAKSIQVGAVWFLPMYHFYIAIRVPGGGTHKKKTVIPTKYFNSNGRLSRIYHPFIIPQWSFTSC